MNKVAEKVESKVEIFFFLNIGCNTLFQIFSDNSASIELVSFNVAVYVSLF